MPVIDITGYRQTQSYLNEIVWRQRRGPYIAVQPVNHAGQARAARVGRTDSIRSWSWEGCEGSVAIVEVYADADRVDLLLDGVKVGSEPAGALRGCLSTFSVPYRPGGHSLQSRMTQVGSRSGGTLSRAPGPGSSSGQSRSAVRFVLTARTWPISRSCSPMTPERSAPFATGRSPFR